MSTTEAPTPDVDATVATADVARAPFNVVAVAGLAVSIASLVVVVIVSNTAVSPVLGLVGVILSAVGIAVSHRTQDRFGGTGGYWFAMPGLLIGLLSLLVNLATFTFIE